MNELRVPKRRVEVELLLSGGSGRRVALFLSEHAPDHLGAERVSDLLNQGGEFLPALDVARGGGHACIARSAVVFVRVPAPGEPEDGAEWHTIPTEHEVEVTLVDGGRLRGLVTYVLPPERSRVLDYLNEPEPFFRLQQREGVVLVNKRHVAEVEVLAP
jgi:hypothetical protein